jgi:hypothetical protein
MVYSVPVAIPHEPLRLVNVEAADPVSAVTIAEWVVQHSVHLAAHAFVVPRAIPRDAPPEDAGPPF